MNDLVVFNEYQNILVLFCIFLPSINAVLKYYENDIQVFKILYISFKQYTNWNIALIFINCKYENKYLNIFITINSTTIFVIYHIFNITNYQMIRKIPNIPKEMNDFQINTCNFFLHILPFLAYVKNFYLYHSSLNFNIGFNVILFNLIWSFQCFLSFNPHTVYFKIERNKIYYLWFFLMTFNFIQGHIFYTRTIS